MLRSRLICIVAILLSARALTAQSDDLLTRVLSGVQKAQVEFTTGCGTVMETRTSLLMAKPMVLHGRFCAAGTNHFLLEDFQPNPMRILLNGDALSMTTADGKTLRRNIGRDVRRVQSSLSGKNSIDALKKDFTVTVQENHQDFVMKLIPRTLNLRHRLNYLVVKLNKQNFLPRSVEVDGKNGVNSVFTIHMTAMNKKLPEDTFKEIQPK